MSDKATAATTTTTSKAPEPVKPESLPHLPARTRKTFIISDLHLLHTNIIKYCHRPYKVAEGWSNKNPANASVINQMNEDILKLFDELPLDCDIWNLGDIFYPMVPEESPERIKMMQSMVARMKGEGGHRKLLLVLGNHDIGQLPGKTRVDFYLNLGFDQVYDTPVVLEDKYILSHEPLFIEKGSPMINLYGHLHDLVLHKDDFCIDYQKYQEQFVLAMRGQGEKPELEISWPECEIDLANYRNMCLDYNKGILEWSGDTFTVAAPIWNN